MGPRKSKSAMPKYIIFIVILVALIGGAAWLASLDSTRPQTKVEKAIPDNALAR